MKEDSYVGEILIFYFRILHIANVANANVRSMPVMLQFSLNLRYQDNMVITYLQPGVEYCVTVSVKTFFKSPSVASEPRCAFTSRPQHATTCRLA